jgi:DNA polymerase
MTKLEMLEKLDTEAVKQCRKCVLCDSRKNTVFGEGSPDCQVMFVGEAPGQNEDDAGRPFVGSAGNLLTGMIQACGWRREDVFIANTIKCRPPGNRTPTEAEIEACVGYLDLQIKIINPKYIVCLGRTAAKWFFPPDTRGISAQRGHFRLWCGRKVIVTYHPSFILHSATDEEADRKKMLVWEDLQILLTDMKVKT